MSRRHAMYDAAGRAKRVEIAASQATIAASVEVGDSVRLKDGSTGSVIFKNPNGTFNVNTGDDVELGVPVKDITVTKKGKGAPKSPAGPKQGKFKDGQKVKLKPFEGQPAQTGVVDGYDAKSKTYIVTIDKQYRKRGDDGLREVSESQLAR